MLSITLIFIALVTQTASSGEWVCSSLPFGDSAESPSMECDPSGNPCIAYIHHPENNVNHLHFARFDGENWFDELLDFTIRDPNVVIDSNGLAHISARDYSNSCIMYYSQNPDMTWNKEVAHESTDLGPYVTRIALDGDNNPHICYYLYNSSLVYLYKDGGDWIACDSLGNSCAPDLALSEAGLPYISHAQEPGYGGTIFCSFIESDQWWTAPIAAATPFQNIVTGIALSSSDTPHVIWSDNGSLNHTTNAGPAWQTEVIYPYLCTLMDMLILPNDNLCAVYAVHEALEFAQQTPSGWELEEVTNQWGEADLASDGVGNFYIAFVDTSDDEFEMVLFHKSTSTGIESFPPERSMLEAYPNPTPASLNLSVTNDYTGCLNLSVFDLQGRIVLAKQCNFTNGSAGLDLSCLQEGIYLLHLDGEILCSARVTVLR